MKRHARRLALPAAAVVAVAAIIGCATGRDAPATDLHPQGFAEIRGVVGASRRDPDRPIVALALGGGGLRGFAHIGVLRALEERGIHPDLIVGTSAGAVVGAAYASGQAPERIQAIALDVGIASLIDFNLGVDGLIRGDKLAGWVDGIAGHVPIERFPRRFAAVATDLESGRAVLLDSGDAGNVVRASSAVPGMNVPVPYRDGHLVDGGVASLVPVRFARALGADVVIAVDIYCRGPRPGGTGAPAVIASVMRTQSCLLAEQEIAQADVLISPEVAVPDMSSRQSREQAILAGYRAARAALASAWRGSRVACGKPRDEVCNNERDGYGIDGKQRPALDAPRAFVGRARAARG